MMEDINAQTKGLVMKKYSGVCWFLPLLISAAQAMASTGSPFYGDPPDERHPWCIHDWNRPQPARVEPGPAKPRAPDRRRGQR